MQVSVLISFLYLEADGKKPKTKKPVKQPHQQQNPDTFKPPDSCKQTLYPLRVSSHHIFSPQERLGHCILSASFINSYLFVSSISKPTHNFQILFLVPNLFDKNSEKSQSLFRLISRDQQYTFQFSTLDPEAVHSSLYIPLRQKFFPHLTVS